MIMKKKEIARQSNSMDIKILRNHNDFRSDNWFLMHGFGPRLDDWLFSRKNAKQRYEKGYCFWDVANMDLWFAEVIPAMLTELKQRFEQTEKHDCVEDDSLALFRQRVVVYHTIPLRSETACRGTYLRPNVTVADLTDDADAVSLSGRPEPPVLRTITSARP